MVLQYSRGRITEFLNHCQDWCLFHTSCYSEASLLYLPFKLQIGGRTAGTRCTSSFPSGFSRQHPPIPFLTLERLLELKYIELSPGNVLIHTLQSAATSVDYRKKNSDLFSSLCAYTHTHIYFSVHPASLHLSLENPLQKSEH